MKRLTRRRFVALTSVGVAGAALTACGADKTTSTDLNPTRIPDVAGAPTLADMATPPNVAAAAAPAGGGGEAATSAEIHTEDIKFDKTELTIAADTDVKITVTNKGALQHDFHVDKLDVTSKILNSGETDTVTINAKAGEYDYWCTIPGHKEAGMVGKLYVVAPGGAASAGGEASPGASPAGEASPAASPAGESGGAAATSVDFKTVDLKFEPNAFTIAADTDVTFNMTNDGALPHDFAMDDPKFTSDVLNGGQSTTFKLKLPAGTYDFYCSEPGHKEAGMVGTLTVQ